MLLSYPPSFIKKIYPSLTWKIETEKKELFLTFDDGPTDGVTGEVLDLLSRYNAKGSFFCLGKNIKKNPELFKQLIEEGHTIGNHTYSHKNGWKHNTSEFLHDVASFEDIHQTSVFRPPYGRMKTSQIKLLKKRYNIIMWSILSQDYDSKILPQKCADISCSNWEKGSIIVFHDSEKARKNMLFALEKVLQKAQLERWECNAISQ